MSDDDDEVVVVGGLGREVFSNLIIQSGHENVDVVLFERKDKKEIAVGGAYYRWMAHLSRGHESARNAVFFFVLVFLNKRNFH